MKCPDDGGQMKEVLLTAGILVEKCENSSAIFLDQGELENLVVKRRNLRTFDEKGLLNPTPTVHPCPSCDHPHMNQGRIPVLDLDVKECPNCKGLFLDDDAVKNINWSGEFHNIVVDKTLGEEQGPAPTHSRKPAPFKIPSLGFTSAAVVGSLYAILFGLMVFLVESGMISSTIGLLGIIGFVLLQFLISPWIMDWTLSLIGSLDWVELNQLPPHLQKFYQKICKDINVPLPKTGIIRDGSPQAYTYGRTPKSARVVVSQGLIDILSEDELETVVAHEMGHVKHWDFVVMTIAQLVPLLLYHVYRICNRASRRSSGSSKNNGKAGLAVAAMVAYVFYVISNYLVMFVSRVREYWADRFAVQYTKNPNGLVRALAKISYGLVTTDNDQKKKDSGVFQSRQSMSPLGIMSIHNSKSLAVAAQGNMESLGGREIVKDAMRWDLWNPWATYYELHSTHPLTAKRIKAISSYAISQGIEPEIVFNRVKPESYWDDFLIDLFFLQLPKVGFVVGGLIGLGLFGIGNQQVGLNIFGLAILGASLGGFIKTTLIYPSSEYLRASVMGLLKKIKVSPMRAYSVTLEGEIIGRGDAGNLFSEDMVIRDKTGILFLNYEQPFAIFNFLFALFRMDKFKDQPVKVTGWYRRAPVPFLEINTITTQDGHSSTSYVRYYKYFGWIALAAVGFFLLLG